MLQFTNPCLKDSDFDGFNDLPATSQQGPSNTVAAQDNCPAVVNPAQTNSDGNFIDLSPPKLFDDMTIPASDAPGDACDTDDDNDYLLDTDELSGAACAGIVTSTVLRDTDGDRAIDGAECALGTNPTLTGSAPGLAACGAVLDGDGDGIVAAREYCYYGSSDGSANTDGDTCGDRRETMSINADMTVNAIDLGQVASAFGPYPFGAPAYFYDYDVTKDGTINAIDLGQVAGAFGACP
jgi:hypothetical protein